MPPWSTTNSPRRAGTYPAAPHRPHHPQLWPRRHLGSRSTAAPRPEHQSCASGRHRPPSRGEPFGEAIDIGGAATGGRPCGPGAVGGTGHWRGPAGLGAAWPPSWPHALALFTMVANRLAEPPSKLAHAYWMAERAYSPEAAASRWTTCTWRWISSTPTSRPSTWRSSHCRSLQG